MITSKLVTPDGIISDICKTGYQSINDAVSELKSDWPIERLSVSNVVVLADYDDCRLILQECKA